MELEEKHSKRIESLIRSGNASIALTVVGVFIPIVAVLGPLIGFGYAIEVGSLLKRYPSLDAERVKKLSAARTKFFVMGCVLSAWLLIVIVAVWLMVVL